MVRSETEQKPKLQYHGRSYTARESKRGIQVGMRMRGNQARSCVDSTSLQGAWIPSEKHLEITEGFGGFHR